MYYHLQVVTTMMMVVMVILVMMVVMIVMMTVIMDGGDTITMRCIILVNNIVVDSEPNQQLEKNNIIKHLRGGIGDYRFNIHMNLLMILIHCMNSLDNGCHLNHKGQMSNLP